MKRLIVQTLAVVGLGHALGEDRFRLVRSFVRVGDPATARRSFLSCIIGENEWELVGALFDCGRRCRKVDYFSLDHLLDFRRRRLVYRRQHDRLFHRRGVGRREISSRIRGILIFPAATACAEEVLGSAGRLKLVGGRGRHRKLGRSVRNLEFGGGGGLYVQQVVRMVRRLELRTNRGTNIDLRRLLVTEHFDTEVGRRVEFIVPLQVGQRRE